MSGATVSSNTSRQEVRSDRPLLELIELTRRYQVKDEPAVDRLDLVVDQGEFVTLLGSSGSGKSTTLMMVAGFETPDNGRIVMRGRDITGVSAHRRNLGVVFQSYLLFPHLSVAENVAFPLKARGVAKVEVKRRVAEALEMVRLGEFGNRMPRHLSGGQQQRVAVARATVSRPELLLMDEPLGSLDERLRRDLQEEIRRFHRELGTAVLYVTHDQVEAMSLSDRIVLLRSGRIEQAGPPDELFERPLSPFVARFMGDAAFLAGKVVAVERPGLFRVDVPAVGEVLTVQGVTTLSTGDAVDMMLRSNAVRVAQTEAEGKPSRPHVTIRVRDVTYVGEDIRLTAVAVVTGETFQAVCATHEMPSVGSEQRLAVDQQHCWLIPAVESLDAPLAT